MKVNGYIQRKPKKEEPTLGGSIESIVQTVSDIQETKKNVIKILDGKVAEVDIALDEIKNISDEGVKKLDEKLIEFEDKTIEIIDAIQNIPQLQGLQGETGPTPDIDVIIKEVISRIPEAPQLDENALLKRFISKIPENKASLKIIQEKFETDPMSVIEKIMALPEGKFKLKPSQIDGLDQTIAAFRSQLSRGYLHGGGLSTISHDNTLTGNGTPQDPLHVVGGGGGSPASPDTSLQFNDGGNFGGSKWLYTEDGGGNPILTATGIGFAEFVTDAPLVYSQNIDGNDAETDYVNTGDGAGAGTIFNILTTLDTATGPARFILGVHDEGADTARFTIRLEGDMGNTPDTELMFPGVGIIQTPSTFNIQDNSLGAAFNDYVWTLIDQTTGEGGWQPGGNGSPASPDTSVQFNDSGAFGGSSEFVFATDGLTMNRHSAFGSLGVINQDPVFSVPYQITQVIGDTYTDASLFGYGIYSGFNVVPDADATGLFVGHEILVNEPDTNTHSINGLYGLEAFVYHNSTTTTDHAIGLNFSILWNAGSVTHAVTGIVSDVENDGSGTIGTLRGMYVTGARNFGDGTITKGEGILIDSAINSGGGTVGSNYGLHIKDQTLDGVVNNWAINVNDNFTISPDGSVAKVSSLGGGGTQMVVADNSGFLGVQAIPLGFQTATGTVNGTNAIFTFSTAPNAIVVDGISFRKVASDGTVNWTGTTVITLSVAPISDIYSVA